VRLLRGIALLPGVYSNEQWDPRITAMTGQQSKVIAHGKKKMWTTVLRISTVLHPVLFAEPSAHFVPTAADEHVRGRYTTWNSQTRPAVPGCR
jgi:hypothetical protein